MADINSKADLIRAGYGGYAGWGEAEAVADYRATGGSGKYDRTVAGAGSQTSSQTSQSSAGNFEDYLKRAQEAQKEAIQPAVQSLQAGIPTSQASTKAQIGQKQAEIAPLKSRYDQLLADIKGQGQTMVEGQTRVTAGELGKRGIEGSSTLAGQEITSAIRPIQQQTQSLTQQTGLAQEADLRDIQNQIQNLGLGQQEREQAINQAIATLQSGGGQSAITNAMQLLSNAQQMQATQQTFEATQKQRDIENALAKIQSESGVKLTNAQIQNIQSQIADRGTTGGTGSAGVSQYYTAPGVTNVTGSSGNYQSQAGGQVLPQAKSWSSSGGATGSW